MSKHVFSGDGVSQEYAVEVHVNVLLPLGISHFVSGSIDADSGVGVAEIEASEFSNDLIHHSLHLSFVGNVALNGDDFAACSSCDFFRGFFCFSDVHVDNSNICSCLCESCCGALAYASCSTGDESLLAVKTHFFYNTQDCNLL